MFYLFLLLIAYVQCQCQSLDYKAVVGSDPKNKHTVQDMAAAVSTVN